MQTNFYVDKTSGTSADTLLAVGFASYLDELYRVQYQALGEAFLHDEGAYYRITLPRPLDTKAIPDNHLQSSLIVLPLDSERQREKLKKKGNDGPWLDGFNLTKEIERSQTHREQLKKLGPAFQTPDARLRKEPALEEIVESEADTRLGHYLAISHMKIASTFNDLALRWDTLTPQQKRFHIQLLLDLFHEACNDRMGAINRWQEYAKQQHIKGDVFASALQITNPTTGKGANRAKGGELTIGNQDSFWLLELLKFRGFMEVAAPVSVKDSDDRKTYIIQPRRMRLSLLQDVMEEFRAIFWPTTAIKLDILASLRFAQVLVEQYRVMFEYEKQLQPWMPNKPASLAQEFAVTFYKYLGSAHATMNLATIGLPAWIPKMKTMADVQAAKALLDEHVHLIRSIQNNKGQEGAEEYELLRFYRDFLSGHDLHSFWEFNTDYSSNLISQREKEKDPRIQIRQLTYKGLEQLIMNSQEENPEAVAILESPGFQHIADAIRSATVFAQYRRSQHDDRTYEAQYGLGRELMRKARHGREFVIALTDFLVRYNDETALEEEKVARKIMNEEKRGQPRPLTAKDRKSHHLRYMTTEDDLKEVVQLTNQYGSELVGSMLVACGYSFKGVNAAEESKNALVVGRIE